MTEMVVVTAYECAGCDVRGRLWPEDEPGCWNCGGTGLHVLARPSIRRDGFWRGTA